MKKNRIAIVLVLILGIVAFWVLKNKNTNSTIKPELRDFAYEDTASITKIFLADKANRTITLERINKSEWKVNGKFIARPDAINTLLGTIKSVEVMNFVPNAAKETIIKSLASTAIKVEVYSKDELVKMYYVGGETQDQLGTYMLLADPKTGENSSSPFITFIPGFNGFLTTRYFTNEIDWRARYIFKYNPDDIASVKVEYFENEENSFEIFNNGNNSFDVKKIKTGLPVENCEVLAIKQYLSYYQNIQYETMFNDASQGLKDSVYSAGPFAKITVINKKNEQNAIKLYHKAARKDRQGMYGKPLQYDPDRLYTWINDEKDFVVIQYFVFGKLLQGINYFTTKPAV